jgi:hypothetical protein
MTMAQEQLYVVAVDMGGFTVPMLVPYSDIRCPTTGADVDHVAVASKGAVVIAIEESDKV